MILQSDSFVFYICSFTNSFNNTDLWERYGNNNKGVCLGISSEFIHSIHKTEYGKTKFIRLESVDYSEERWNAYINKLISKIEELLSSRRIELNEKYYQYLTSELALFIFSKLPKMKTNNWASQNEWRIFQVCYLKNFNLKLKRKGRLARPKNRNY